MKLWMKHEIKITVYFNTILHIGFFLIIIIIMLFVQPCSVPPLLITVMTEYDTLTCQTHTRIPNKPLNIKRLIIIQFIQALLFTR